MVGEKSLGEKSLGEKSLGEKSLGEKSLGEKSLGEKSLGEKYLGFASDNYADISPEVLESINSVVDTFAPAYGLDNISAVLDARLTELFSTEYQFYPCLNGTGGNIAALASLTTRFGLVICPKSAHIIVSESSSVANVAGILTRDVDTIDGKLQICDIAANLWGKGDVHKAQPQVISIAQPTECGTVYTLEELATLIDYAHDKGLKVHMDGSRLPLAAQHLDCSLSDTSTALGVDSLLLGATKLGGMCAEVIIAKKEVELLPYLKLTTQLASKMRYISAQIYALYGPDELWRKNSYIANSCAKSLAAQLMAANLAGLSIKYPVETNTLFVTLPDRVKEKLLEKYFFYQWEDDSCRWITNFRTTQEDIDQFFCDIVAAFTLDSDIEK